MMATTGPSQWHCLGLLKLVREPTDNDKGPIVNPLRITDIDAEIGSMTEVS